MNKNPTVDEADWPFYLAEITQGANFYSSRRKD
jgi:hypothetical protein